MPELLPAHFKDMILHRLKRIYGDDLDERFLKQFLDHIQGAYNARKSRDHKQLWSQEDVILITYGDQVRKATEKPLITLHRFLHQNLSGIFSYIHILPFFPYSSDDGFSVIDYMRVDAQLGDWEDISGFTGDFKLMADLVINHVSAQNVWFQNFLADIQPGADFFIEMPPDTKYKEVTRPRNIPLFTPFKTNRGTRFVWTTFSDDQVDLNFSNPKVLLEIIKVLLFYIKQGIKLVRLDAIAFIWKKKGTSCIHLPEVHEIVKIFRGIVDLVAPGTILLTETNVPHQENISYFGNGEEAHMIYQFSLPPLLLYALYTGSSEYLVQWAKDLNPPPPYSTFLNFTASHDGIGVRPLEGLIPDHEKDILFQAMVKQGGMLSRRSNPDGTSSVYEMNITYFDALGKTLQGDGRFQCERFICSQTIMLAFKGIPAIYFQSLIASENDIERFKKTGQARSLNRRKWDIDMLMDRIDHNKKASRVFHELKRRIRIRKEQPAFHPVADQEILDLGNALFAFIRSTGDLRQTIFCVSNLTAQPVLFPLPFSGDFKDLLSDQIYNPQNRMLEPYQSIWLTE